MPHLPALQLADPPGTEGQTFPQAPQLLVSLSKLKQTPPQSLYPASQANWQLPAAQPGAPCAVPGHIFAQVPQLVGSALRSTQAPPQFAVPLGQFRVQVPPLHTSPLLQARPQAPQFAGSLLVLMQAPAQAAKPALHNVWHCPALQLALPLAGASQCLPQAPQLRGSV